jgi:hypothetical protein
MVGDEVKISITSLPVRHPHDAAQGSGTYGGQSKAVGCSSPRALLFLRGCLIVTILAGGLAGCAVTATQQTAQSASTCLQDVRSSQEGQIVYAKLWASDATDTEAKLSDLNPLTPTELDALAQVHNEIISCRQTIISDNSRSGAWELPYWLDYFKRSDAIFDKLASSELPIGLANKLTIESNGKFQADVSRSHPDAVPVDEIRQQQSAEALMQASAQITAPEPQSKLASINCRWIANTLSCAMPSQH